MADGVGKASFFNSRDESTEPSGTRSLTADNLYRAYYDKIVGFSQNTSKATLKPNNDPVLCIILMFLLKVKRPIRNFPSEDGCQNVGC